MKRLFIRAALLAALATGAIDSAHADFTISNKATHDVSCSAGVCTATAKGANLNVTDLTNMLAAGDTTVKFGGGALAIQVQDGFSWTSTSRLTLDANTSVGFHKPVTVAGKGALTITYNDLGSGGDLKFFDTGKIDFWNTSSSLNINGHSYTLLADLITLINDTAVSPSGYYALATDISQPLKLGHAPVKYFSGTFEGLGNSISGLVLHTRRENKSIGFFGSSSGIIRDLHLARMDVAGGSNNEVGALTGKNFGLLTGDASDGTVAGNDSDAVGGLVGWNSGTIEGCNTSGTVTGGRESLYIGGLAGANTGTVEYSSSSADVAGEITVLGGLVGTMSGTVMNSHATGRVGGSTTSNAGGLVGLVNSGTIANSYAAGDVTAYGSAGGLVDLNGGTISQSFATGSVYGVSNQNDPSQAGGLVAYSYGTIQNAYATGSVKVDLGSVGGFIGGNSATITASYSLGTSAAVDSANSDVGGYIGNDMGTVAFGYWDMDTSGIDDPGQGAGNRRHDPGVKGESDATLKSTLPKGFDPKIWRQSPKINHGYPYLHSNPPQ
ncbi:MAG TPA: GLUG motif-containing protein [Rhizomicrobium sp.]|jgi:hypothetical protein|nr:GLUG motif-containing protein [Rhizomicrobium sp.]